MATRSNIVLKSGKNRVFIYRHWDGYPAETGADLIEKISASGRNAHKFLEALLTEKDEGTSYRDPSNVYELTTELHGDIEWLYLIQFDGTTVTAAAAHVGFDDDEDSVFAGMSPQPLGKLVELVNRERREMNARLLAIKAKHPDSVYKDCDCYEPIAAA